MTARTHNTNSATGKPLAMVAFRSAKAACFRSFAERKSNRSLHPSSARASHASSWHRLCLNSRGWENSTHAIEPLISLWQMQTEFRLQRFWNRLWSPRQALASCFAIGFVALYLIAGLTILSRRDAADPTQLRLWLSGGMILYALYHTVKQLWSTPVKDGLLEHASPAAALWLGGGPIGRRLLVVREAATVIPATLTKTLLLGVVLWRDAVNLPLLLAGVFLALLALELLRRIATCVIEALQPRERKLLQGVCLIVGLALVGQLGWATWTATPQHSDPVVYVVNAIAEVANLAASDSFQWLASALLPAAHLAVSSPLIPGVSFAVAMAINAALAVLVVFLLGRALIAIDAWAIHQQRLQESDALQRLQDQGLFQVNERATQELRTRTIDRIEAIGDVLQSLLPESQRGVTGIITRQLHCVRRYRINVLLSFAIPVLLSLSPLLTDQTSKQWIFVIGGIALSSLLLAPPALQIDFRRDLKRMLLLRSLPIRPATMCLGLLSVPVLITILFQWFTLGVGAWIASASLSQTAWLAAALPALAVLTFATENALFLAFPHHVHAQGIAMVIRAKATFLWKGVVLAACPFGLLIWSMLCQAVLPDSLVVPAAFCGSLAAAWAVAFLSVTLMVRCWSRFDPVQDTPPA